MFELFTDEARHVIVRAQEWAREGHLTEIGTAELLAALAGAEGQEARAALAEVGVTDILVREQVLISKPRSRRPPQGHIPFTAGLRTALDRAGVLALGIRAGDEPLGGYESLGSHAEPGGRAAGSPTGDPGDARSGPARRPGMQDILRPGHLLLALLGDPGCTAVTLLVNLGVDLDQLRQSTRRMLDAWPPGPGRSGWTPAAGTRPEGRHRPAGTSRFPLSDEPSYSPLARHPGSHPARAGQPDMSGAAAAGAAWGALQRRQADLPLWALHLWRGDMAIRGSEARAARRLVTRLPLSADDARALLYHHNRAVDEIIDGVFGRQEAAAQFAAPPPLTVRDALAQRPRGRRLACWAMRLHPRRWPWPRPVRRRITRIGHGWGGVLELALRVLHRP